MLESEWRSRFLNSPTEIYGVELCLEDEFSSTKIPTLLHLSEPKADSGFSGTNLCLELLTR